jgi:predicted dehydrogenase
LALNIDQQPARESEIAQDDAVSGRRFADSIAVSTCQIIRFYGYRSCNAGCSSRREGASGRSNVRCDEGWVRLATCKPKMTRREIIKGAGYTVAATALLGVLPARADEEAKGLTVAVVGGAHIHTPQYVDALKNRKGVKVKAVWDHDSARAEKLAGELNSKVGELEAIWSDPEITAIVVCSETDRHHDLVLAAAQAKKHMFVEKPLGITAKDSFAMAAAIEKAGVLFTTGYFMRTSPENLFLKDQIAKGNLGKITRVRGSNCHNGSLGGWFDGEYRWMADPKIAGVGAYGDLGTHALDILMWLLGGVESVTADIKIITNRYPGCDETGEGLLKFDNGVIGTLAAGWVDVADPVKMLISGTEGHASIINGQLFFQSSNVDGATGKDPWKDMPAALNPPIQQFLDAVEGKTVDTLVKPSEAAARVAVMEAAYKGAKTNSWVTVAQK